MARIRLYITFIVVLFGGPMSAASEQRADTSFRQAAQTAFRAQTHYRANRLDSAIVLMNAAIKLYPELRIEEKKTAYAFLAQLYLAASDAQNAEATILKLLDLARKTNDKALIGRYESFIGSIYRDTGQSLLARQALERSVEAAKSAADHQTTHLSLALLADLYNHTGQTAKALQTAKESLQYAALTASQANMGDAWVAIASVYYQSGNLRSSIDGYRKAMAHYSQAGQTTQWEMAKNSMLDLLGKVGDTKEAVDSIQQPAAAKNIEFTERSGAYEQDELAIERNLDRFNALDKQSKFETLRQDYVDQQEATHRRQLIFVGAIAALGLAALGLLYGRQRLRTKAARAAAEVKQKEKEYAELQQQTEQKLIRNYIEGLEYERSRIAKELHDGVCNDLLGVEMAFVAAGLEPSAIEPLRQTRQNVRAVSHELHPPEFRYASIDQVLADYAVRHPSAAVEYHSNTEGPWHKVDHQTAFELYRIVQEAVANSLKHAHASAIKISLDYTDSQLVLELADNGQGFDPRKAKNGIGLKTIYDRVKEINGTIEIDSSSDTGTKITIRTVGKWKH